MIAPVMSTLFFPPIFSGSYCYFDAISLHYRLTDWSLHLDGTSTSRSQPRTEYQPYSLLHISQVFSKAPVEMTNYCNSLCTRGSCLCQYVSCAFIFVPMLVWQLSTSLPYAHLCIPISDSFRSCSLDFLRRLLIKKKEKKQHLQVNIP